MKIGVEEEYIVTDAQSLDRCSGSFLLAAHLIYQQPDFIRKCSVEFPLHSGSIKTILSKLNKAFCVFEVKTDPSEDLDRIAEELCSHRNQVNEVALDHDLMVLPTGLHPLHRSTDFVDHCAAFHVHLDYDKSYFKRLRNAIPFFIHRSANSPFIDHNLSGRSNRLGLSPHIGFPIDEFQRNADIIHNPSLGTVEVKVFDTQITSEDSMGLVTLVKRVAEQSCFDYELPDDEYQRLRLQAIQSDSVDDFLPKECYDTLCEDPEISEFLNRSIGADWQQEVFEKHGLIGVITSLWDSFQKDKKSMRKCNQEMIKDQSVNGHLWYLFPYAPFLCIDKYKKYRQDISYSGGLRNINITGGN